jgi:hypothetical protein
MTAFIFLGFVAAMTAITVAIVARYLRRTMAFAVLGSLSAWFTYAGLLGYLGVVRNTTTRPPGVVLLVGGFGILKWPTSAVCFGPPWAKRTSNLDLSDELGSGGGVGLESQGGVIRADPA